MLYDASTYDIDPFEPQGGGLGTIFPIIVSDVSTKRSYVELPYTLCQDFLLFCPAARKVNRHLEKKT